MSTPGEPDTTTEPTSTAARVAAGVRLVPAGLVALAVYVALEWLGFIHEVKGLPATPWNPGLGVVFALVALDGPLAAAVLFAGIVLAEILVVDTVLSWPLVLAVAAIETGCYAAAGLLALRAFRIDPRLGHLRDVLLLLAAGLAGACVVALLLTVLLIVFGDLGLRDVLAATVPLLVGDVIGIAVITPLVLRLAAAWRAGELTFAPALALEGMSTAAVIGACLWLVTASPGPEGFKYFHLLALPVVTAAVRHGLDGACLALAGVQLGLVALLHLHGHDIRVFTEYQALMLVLTATGLVVGVVVSERRAAERLARAAERRAKTREAEAAQAGRFHLVSSMASALAHEITQPMTAARALARAAQHILQTPGGDHARAEANLATVIAQIDHAGAVIRRTRDLLRRGAPVRDPIAIAPLIDDVLAIAAADPHAHGVAFVTEAPAGLPVVTGDRIQLQQALLNLVRNAVEAITAARVPNGRVSIAAACPAAASGVAPPEGALPGVEITVSDNGPGVSDDVVETLFEPLVTTKPEGLGLGLAMCAAIVEQHGGRIALVSGAPGATTFRVTLPIEGSASRP
ncbi:hypothetical protein CCR97_29380 [Rhodoplanes elegans]|uniref:histidine kinase n=1 Tax=Rhodoplanes elegans TaxID=29408 RepID=A0A327KC03_9BRAD|nr:ATP-binding protein [Rhodoplanes elegans]MBK5962271.1 hypothetical protein [Rhodoplanes elegans]RAI35681.1 hypothetical protein CH338_18805 [Rhodoplanes elegans]